MEEERIYLNALNLVIGENYSKLFSLYKELQSFKLIWQELPSQIRQTVNPLQEWKRLAQENVQLLTIKDNLYPSLLRQIPNPPLGIYIKGNVSFSFPTIAVVGTRKVSNYGRAVIKKLIPQLVVEANFIVVSGLAYGIDSLAHQEVLEHQGITWAVLGSGLNKIFPALNKKLAQKITERGALISEYPLSVPPLKHHFPWRNRIISGLSLGTIVIEAPVKSGALITANFALEQNREVFAVPGSIFNKNSQGNHLLIQQGAKLVQKIEDIAEELNIILPKTNKIIDAQISSEENTIYKLLSADKPSTIDKIKEKVNLKTNQILAILSNLEIKGLIYKANNGAYFRSN